MREKKALLLMLVFFLLEGCAAQEARWRRPGNETICLEFLEDLDAEVVRAGVRDASSHSIQGFPHLRTTRFLTAISRTLRDQDASKAWVNEMAALGLAVREREISNLPDEEATRLVKWYGGSTGKNFLYDLSRQCTERLLSSEKERTWEDLREKATVSDEYSFLQSALGLYPLAALPVALLTLKARSKIKSYFQLAPEKLPLEGALVAFIPAKELQLSQEQIKELLRNSKANSLGIPILDLEDQQKLAMSLAPVFYQDVAHDRDLLGRVHWSEGRIEVDRERPSVYYYFSTAFLKRMPVLQINYVIWYSERGGRTTPWFERGSLDGLTLRFTLDPEGHLAVVDAINNCGCYHMFFPKDGLVERFLDTPQGLGPFVPTTLPMLSQGSRLGLRVSSGRHQVQGLLVAGKPTNRSSYDLIPFSVLEALPKDHNATESVFDAKGILKGSERAERFLLFSMGIPNLGSMRQRGHHAIGFFERAHFDDPDLLDRSFVFK